VQEGTFGRNMLFIAALDQHRLVWQAVSLQDESRAESQKAMRRSR
jgi:hypothetical protein